MKKILAVLAAISLLSLHGTAFALPIVNKSGDGFEDFNGTRYAYYQNSGKLLGQVQPGNANPSNPDEVQDYLNGLVGYQDVSLVILDESKVTLVDYDTYGNIITSGEALSGTWSTVSAGYSLEFYALKAGNAFALYAVNPADNYGSWSTYDIWVSGLKGTGGNGGVEISHFVGYNSVSTPVPEPSTILMLGAGILGLGLYGRRRARK